MTNWSNDQGSGGMMSNNHHQYINTVPTSPSLGPRRPIEMHWHVFYCDGTHPLCRSNRQQQNNNQFGNLAPPQRSPQYHTNVTRNESMITSRQQRKRIRRVKRWLRQHPFKRPNNASASAEQECSNTGHQSVLPPARYPDQNTGYGTSFLENGNRAMGGTYVVPRPYTIPVHAEPLFSVSEPSSMPLRSKIATSAMSISAMSVSVPSTASMKSAMSVTEMPMSVQSTTSMKSSMSTTEMPMSVQSTTSSKSSISILEMPMSVESTFSSKSSMSISQMPMSVESTASMKSAMSISEMPMSVDSTTSMKSSMSISEIASSVKSRTSKKSQRNLYMQAQFQMRMDAQEREDEAAATEIK